MSFRIPEKEPVPRPAPRAVRGSGATVHGRPEAAFPACPEAVGRSGFALLVTDDLALL